MITYQDSPDAIAPEQLTGFFVGWPDPPTPQTHLRILQRSSEVVLARDGARVVGFITAISDGVLAAYLPLLEVLPEYQGRGIGGELVRRMLARLADLYMIDLVCDPELQGFYAKHGLQPLPGMGRRDLAHQSGRARDTV